MIYEEGNQHNFDCLIIPVYENVINFSIAALTHSYSLTNLVLKKN